nr:GNAT family N-acetyltransferase [uncultured Celeribacter sp.]
MMTTDFQIRPAVLQDATAIAEVQVAVWRTAYREILPGALIDRMTVPDREKGWIKILETYEETGRGAVFVAECEGRVVGFLSCGDQRDNDLTAMYNGEISAIYVADEMQHKGVGTALMARGAQALQKMGHDAHGDRDGRGARAGVALWVLSENAGARGFYEALGGTVVARRWDNQPEGAMNEVAYGWADLATLMVESHRLN